MTIFRQIRERRMFQITAAYVVGAWAVLGVFDQLTDRGIFGAHGEVVYKIALIWVIIGVPAALLIGWNHGEKGAQSAPRSEIVSLILLALVAFGFSGMQVVQARNVVLQKAALDDVLDVRKVAVLYFDDKSPDKKHDFLAEGFTESLIQELTQVRDLTVISRNGSARVRGQGLSVEQIADTLGAGTIIEGVLEEKDANTLRVSVHLRDGKSGVDLSEPFAFEMPAGEVLAMTDTLVAKTAERLRTALGKEVRVRDSARGTDNTQAFLLLQRAEKSRKNAEAAPPTDTAAVQKLYSETETLLDQAQQADPKWSEPAAAHAWLLYRRAYRNQNNRQLADELATKSLPFAEKALQLDKNSARALEARGTANYFKVLLEVNADPATEEKLLNSAREDLIKAKDLDGSLATAHATLSHLYYREGNMSNAVIEAQAAYEADAYLEAADLVVWRLFNGAWELGDFAPAKRWCDVGKARFPTNYRFAACELRLMTSSTAQPSVDSAWALLARHDSLVPPPRRAFEHLRNEMVVAGAIARRATQDARDAQMLRDSAGRVLDRVGSQITPQIDGNNELTVVEAYVRAILGQKDAAITLLQRVKARNPAQFDAKLGLDKRWYWVELQADPKFKALFTN
jgi:TolB-like protein